jgi:hypothetical protein
MHDLRILRFGSEARDLRGAVGIDMDLFRERGTATVRVAFSDL